MENFDTWLEPTDLQRIWDIVMNDGNEDNLTKDELEEFKQVLSQVVSKRSLN